MQLVLVMLAGAVGVAARYGLVHTWPLHPGSGFPWSTLTVNVLGAALLGALMAWGRSGQLDRATWFPILGTGLLGGFTTYSTFAFDAVALVDANRTWTALVYVGATNALGITAAAVSFAAVRSAA